MQEILRSLRRRASLFAGVTPFASAYAQYDTGSCVATGHDSNGAIVQGTTFTVANTQTGIIPTRALGADRILGLPLNGQTEGTLCAFDQPAVARYTRLFSSNMTLDAQVEFSRTKAGKCSTLLPTIAAVLFTMPLAAQNPFTNLMQKTTAHASEYKAKAPSLSPADSTILNGAVPITELQISGIKIVPWTTNDPEKMRAIIRLGVDGLISDRPDLLQKVVAEERSRSPEAAARLKTFDVQGHRGGRGLRPENTLPSFESGMDQGITTIETDTGVTSDRVSLIWHDQFLNPQSCRHADGTPYETKVYIRDLSMPEAQRTYICDKLHFGPDQTNDLTLSPVAVAFAAQEHLISPYAPTYVGQLFRFTHFYTEYYRTGPGKTHPDAAHRAHTGETVHFNLETKVLPPLPQDQQDPRLPAEIRENHTVSPQIFVETLCGVIRRNHMQSRADVQSFDFRTLLLVAEQYPEIATSYLTEDPTRLKSSFVPQPLR